MKLKNILGLVVSALVLSGCAMTPQETDKSEPKVVFDTAVPFEDLYFKLTTPATGERICDTIYSSAIYPERGEFRVYYGISAGYAQVEPFVHSAVYGYRTKEGSRVEIRNVQEPKFGAQRVPSLTNFIKTGRCE